MANVTTLFQQVRGILNRLTSLESRRQNPLSGTGAIDSRLIATNASYTWTFTDANAKVGDRILVGTSTALVSDSFAFFSLQARCVADGEILLTICNVTSGGVLTAAGTITYSILKN